MYTWIWIPVMAGIFAVVLAMLRWLFTMRRSGPTGKDTLISHPEQPEEKRTHRGEKTLRNIIKSKRALPKEVELAWEASDIIDIQPGAYARTGKEPAPWEKPAASGETSGGTPASIERQAETLPAETRTHPEESYELPSRYGVDRLVLLARDPHWLYAYWEITHQKYAEMRDRHLREWDLSRPLLRLSDITPGVPQEQRHLDVYITEEANNWYIHVGRPRHTLFAEIGRLLPHSVFVPLVRSNAVTLPPDSVSEEISEEWAPLEWPERYPRYRRSVGLSSPWVRGQRS